ncbi:NUMOD1 domain-containing DNA-binding protein [Lentilactobacillus farraginis]|uniref:Uncharacterized protein n=1 Tax=Lentilactobacillus farraginis DSM 18382 = JCM 14108 TaxID=1423743 RepID=X0PC37_9LACO|nr:NUMOD1 domain-containing DNA-binding protein [Lentilactobacillus farraginis]KRM05014.1 hypothetical protein FD41_GL000777 [Lentilactobacillus farraginis DSM 18382 = JCM 14108]GAF37949.1 hypothetical protein JCM14108_3040 [Lentilactobacillus farraginis DSM 18382 = JCM 14108]
MKPITYQGKKFSSYQKAADYIGITKPGFSKRLKKYEDGQLTLDELFSHDNFHLTNRITYKGKVFRNHTEAAKFIGITPVSFHRRFKKYQLGELSLDELFQPSNYTIYELPEYHGKHFKSKSEAAKFLGISLNSFARRLKYYHEGKYVLDDVFATSPHELQMRQIKDTSLHYKGQHFHTQIEASKYLGIAQSTFSTRYQKYLAGKISLDRLFQHK